MGEGVDQAREALIGPARQARNDRVARAIPVKYMI
jgi:hypothetical protein